MDVFGIHPPRANGCAGVAVFHAEVGSVPVFQIVANGVVVGHGVAAHIIQSVFFFHMLGCASYHHGQLTFIVHVSHALRSACKGLVTNERGLTFDKHQWFFRRFESQFFGMVSVVQPQSQNGSGLRHRRQWWQPHHLVKLQALASPWAAREQQLAIRFHRFVNGACPCNACVLHTAPPANEFTKVSKPSAEISTTSPALARGLLPSGKQSLPSNNTSPC